MQLPLWDNDRIGPSLGCALLSEIFGGSFFENFYDCRNPYFNMLSIFFQQKLASAFSTQWPEGVNCRYCFIVLTTILVVRVAGCIELEKATLSLGWGRFSTRKKKMAGILVPRKLGRNRCLDLRHCTLKLVFYLEKRHAFSLLQNRPAIICLQNLSKVFVF